MADPTTLWPAGTDWAGQAAPTVWGPYYAPPYIPKGPVGVRAP
jgi:hypothetical protein